MYTFWQYARSVSFGKKKPGKSHEHNVAGQSALIPDIPGRGIFYRFTSWTSSSQDHRIPHNGRSCFSLHPPGSTTPSTCVYNPEAFARARTKARNIKKILCIDTFPKNTPEKFQILLSSPLPPSIFLQQIRRNEFEKYYA